MKNVPVRNTIRFMQWVTLTFILVLGLLVVHDSLRDSRVLGAGRVQLDELKLNDLGDPELAKTVRDLDHLYRATYFQTQDRRAYGFLLLGAAFLLLGALMVLERFLFPPPLDIPDPAPPAPEKERKEILVFSLIGIAVLCALIFSLRFAQPIIPAITAEPDGERQTAQTTPEKPPAEISVTMPVEEISLAVALEEETSQWPQFRGSVLPNKNPLPPSWDFTEKWNVRIPLAGYNSPVVWGDKIFTAGGNETERAVFCYDAESGEQQWKAVCSDAPRYPDVSEDTGISASTLCVDKHRVYAVFATGETFCCTHAGEVAWRRQMPSPEIMYGYASSPLLLGDKLLVQYDMEEMQTLYALSVFTGEILWQTEREAAMSWSSPTALLRDGKALVFTAGNKTAEVFDAETGDILWQKECMGGEVATSAFAAENAFYFSNAGAFTGAFSAADGEILCRNDSVPAPDVASSVLCAGKYVLFTSGGSMITLDAESGEELHEEVFDNGFYASPVVLQDKIVAVNLDGDLFLVDVSPETPVIEKTFSTGKKIVAIPAFYKGSVIVRTFENELIRLEAKP